MKKRIVSIGLVVCLVFSILALSMVGVYAVEEDLYALPTTEVVNSYDFSSATDDEIAAGNITSQTGSVTVEYKSAAGTGGTVCSKDGSALKVVTNQIYSQSPYAEIKILPNEFSDDVSKVVTTLKFKNTYTDASGIPVVSADKTGVCNVGFAAIGQDYDGTYSSQTAAFYGAGTVWRKGTRAQHGVSHYSLMDGVAPTADADGYFSLRLESYKDENGLQHTDLYGEGSTTPIVKNVYCDNTLGSYADKLGYGTKLTIGFTANDSNTVQNVWIKDVKTEFIRQKGFIKAYSTDNGVLTVNTENENIAIRTFKGGANSASHVNFAASKPVDKGTVVIDFDLKKSPLIVNEIIAGADFRRSFGVYGTGGSLLTLSAIKADGKGMVPYNFDAALYWSYKSGAETTVYNYMSDDSVEWEPIRFVISRPTTDDFWSVAMYNMSESTTVPVYTTYDYSSGIGNFSGLRLSYYRNTAARSAMSTDSTKAAYVGDVDISNFSMKITDDVMNTASYSQHRYVTTEGTYSNMDFFTISHPNTKVYTASWQGNLYIRSKNDPKVILAIYDSNNKLIGIKMVDKNSGLKDGFNKEFKITIDNLPTTWKASAKLFIIDQIADGKPLVKSCEKLYPVQ